MRKPYPLSHDLYSLIFEAATEPQRNLHFPLFRHAGTRVAKPRIRRGRPLSAPTAANQTGWYVMESSAGVLAVGQHFERTGKRSVSERCASESPQLELFAAAA